VIRWVLAGNASPLTLDGTRTFLIGQRQVAVIDPGPASRAHLDAVADAVGDGAAMILLTHGHADHAAGANALAGRLGVAVRSCTLGNLADGDRIETDAGALMALAMPGHTPDHFCFHLPAQGAVFCGDLLTGGLPTALVASPEGDLANYLKSLDRLRSLEPRVLYPAHGPAFLEAAAALDAYGRHRRAREEQVLRALASGASTPLAIVDRVYGTGLEPGLRQPAAGAVQAYLEHLEATGRVRRDGPVWTAV